MKKKICFVVATPMTAKAFLLEHMEALSEFYQISMVANFQGEDFDPRVAGGVTVFDVPIARNISLSADFVALIKLYRLFRAEQFDVVHSVTPKAGLLAMLASKAAGISHRFHTFTGQVWATKTGLFRSILMFLDKVIYACASNVLVDSPSQRDFLLSHGVVQKSGSSVLGDGSIAGVDIVRFKPNTEKRVLVRKNHGIPEDGFVFLFLGRLNHEKGIVELLQAFAQLEFVAENAYLLVVGPDEDGVLNGCDALVQQFGSHFIRVGFTKEPELYMNAADVFCLPSHREGFGTVILEAAATGVPALGSDIYGVSDAIDDGNSGLLHEKGNADDLASKMKHLLGNKELVAGMGRNAHKRVHEQFTSARVVQEMVNFYRDQV